MEPLVDGVEQVLAEQLRAVHRLTVALHRARSAQAFYDEAIDTVTSVLGTDRASLLLFDPDGVMRFKAWRGLSDSYRQAVEGHSPWGPDDLDARPLLVPDVEADAELAGLLPVLRAEGIGAAAFVPLLTADALIGKFMLYHPRPYAFPAGEVAVAEILAGHVALAVERHRVQEQLRAAAGEAHATAGRLASLQTVTAALSRAVTREDVFTVVLEVALGELGAASGSLCLIDGENLHLAAAVGYPPGVSQRWARFPLTADVPAAEVVRTGRVVLLPDAAATRARYPVFAAHAINHQAHAIVPLGEEIPLGALAVGFREARLFGDGDVAFLTALGGQCAAALGRAQLYEERDQARRHAEAARAGLTFLAEASAVLASSLDYLDTLARVAQLAVPQLAELCAIYLLHDNRVQLAALAHADPGKAAVARALVEAYPVRLDAAEGVGAVLRTGASQLFAAVTEEQLAAAARDQTHLEQLRRLQLGAGVVVALTARDRVIGALALVTGAGTPMNRELLSLAEQLAARAGTAIDNARLFTARTATARTLQAALLPPQLPPIAGLDLGARYVAGAAGVDVGGDFYDVLPLHGERHLLALGDVRGRGVDAATTALLIRHIIHSAAVNLRTPAAILTHLNDVLLHGADSADPEPRFATAVLALVHPRPDGTVAVTLATAGHPLPLLRSRHAVRSVGSPGTALGITQPITVTDHTVLLYPGDVLALYTDGATERRHGKDFFGETRLAEALTTATGDAGQISAALEHAVAIFSDQDITDDLALLVLRAPV